MKRVIQSPLKYVQGPDQLATLAENVAILGKVGAFTVVDAFILEKQEPKIVASFQKSPVQIKIWKFGGECSQTEVDKIIAAVKESKFDVIVGIGGGKTLDTAKAVSFYLKLPVIVAPSAASSDAPCSALSVMYKDNHQFDRYLVLPRNPDLVLMDTNLILTAPVRMLISGIGDALATYYEAHAVSVAKKRTMAGGICSVTGLAIGQACRDTLFQYGVQAKKDAEAGKLSEAVENIIEANTYLSGIGFESGGLAGAHAIHNGMTALEETHSYLHGEKVAFGTLVHLVLIKAPDDELKKVITFCRSVGLPTSLKQLGISNASRERLVEVAKLSLSEGDTMRNMPIVPSVDEVVEAIIKADKIGSSK